PNSMARHAFSDEAVVFISRSLRGMSRYSPERLNQKYDVFDQLLRGRAETDALSPFLHSPIRIHKALQNREPYLGSVEFIYVWNELVVGKFPIQAQVPERIPDRVVPSKATPQYPIHGVIVFCCRNTLDRRQRGQPLPALFNDLLVAR